MKGCRLGEMKGCLRRGRLFGRDIALLGKINPIKAYLKIKKKKNVIILRLIISHLMLTLIHPQMYIHDLNAVMGVSSNATQHKKIALKSDISVSKVRKEPYLLRHSEEQALVPMDNLTN